MPIESLPFNFRRRRNVCRYTCWNPIYSWPISWFGRNNPFRILLRNTRWRCSEAFFSNQTNQQFFFSQIWTDIRQEKTSYLFFNPTPQIVQTIPFRLDGGQTIPHQFRKIDYLAHPILLFFKQATPEYGSRSTRFISTFILTIAITISFLWVYYKYLHF